MPNFIKTLNKTLQVKNEWFKRLKFQTHFDIVPFWLIKYQYNLLEYNIAAQQTSKFWPVILFDKNKYFFESYHNKYRITTILSQNNTQKHAI